MRRDFFRMAFAVTVLAAPAAADPAGPPDPTAVVQLNAFPEAVAGANSLLAPPTESTLAAAITGVQTGTQFRATFAPFQTNPDNHLVAVDSTYWNIISESKFGLLFDSKSNLFTLSYSTAYNPFSLRSRRAAHIIARVKKDAGCGERYVRSARTPADKAEESACARKAVADEWPALYGYIPYISFTIGAGVFPSGTTTDPLNMMLTAPLEPWGGITTNLDFLFRPTQTATTEVWGTYKNTRPSGAPRTQLANSWGAGLTASVLAWPFLSDKQLPANDDYVQKGFIPGIALGASVQYLHCYGGIYCDSGKIDDESLTPFVEIRATPKLQFRVSVPIERYASVMIPSGIAVAPTFTVGGALGSL